MLNIIARQYYRLFQDYHATVDNLLFLISTVAVVVLLVAQYQIWSRIVQTLDSLLIAHR